MSETPPRGGKFPLRLEQMARPPKKLVSSPGEPQAQAPVGTQFNPAMTASATARRSGGANQAAAGRSTGLGLDSEGVRRSMVERLRASGPLDARVLDAVAAVPRHLFVDAALVTQAYEDTSLPIGHGQTISKPSVVTRMIGVLMDGVTARAVGHLGKVLEVGTGSGYQSAILSKLARRVYTIERHRDLMQVAERRFKDCNLHNITTLVGDGYKGWPAQAPFDRILVTAAARLVPPELVAQLSDEGGIMVLPVGDVGGLHQEVIRVRKEGTQFQSERLFPVRFVPLVQGLPQDHSAARRAAREREES